MKLLMNRLKVNCRGKINLSMFYLLDRFASACQCTTNFIIKLCVFIELFLALNIAKHQLQAFDPFCDITKGPVCVY